MAQPNFGSAQEKNKTQPSTPAQPLRKTGVSPDLDKSGLGQKKSGEAWEREQDDDMDSSRI